MDNKDPRIEEIQRYIQTHITEPLDCTTLAKAADLSVVHLQRLFVDQVGEPPATYIRRLRLNRSGLKLRMGAVDIGEVALAAGYGSHNAFTKAFKQHFGLSPSQFRQLSCPEATKILTKDKS
ncbi:MAG: AraC family transcriptional regulator [Chloroflexota bacterium]